MAQELQPEKDAARCPKFPVHGILPKEETGAARFLSEHKEYDGRGVVVAILDTGVDPGAPGLQITSDGKPKIIDIIDCSGSGDVDTTTVVEPGEDGTIQGLSGRTIKRNPDWKNPSGKYHLGIKRAYELYPKALKQRVKDKRKEEWTLRHRKVEADLQRQVAEFKSRCPKPTTQVDIDEQADLDARVAQLSELMKSYDDPGPLWDIVCWHDGDDTWEVVVDVEERGDVSAVKPMTNYKKRREWRTFRSELENINYCVNVYEEGSVVSICVDAGSHGTHVAGITAAHHPENPELDGLAPGAQLISLKIGDSRLGSMETGTAVVRAMIEVVRAKVDLLNMSYGEASSTVRTGRVVNLIEDVVNKHGVIYVGSASNNGPALSTVGAPGGSGTSTIGVGAYLSQSMMLASYSLRKQYDGTNFTWSSVGPSLDGHEGPVIVAPGGAITCVPTWTLQKAHLMNGTSMASPNACGSLALVVSGLKAKGICYTPQLIRRAAAHTAKPVNGLSPLMQGHGMLQVQGTFDYVVKNHEEHPLVNLPMKLTVTGAKGGRGIYLRDAGESELSRDFKVTVDPQFHDEAASEQKVNFESRIALSLSDPSAAEWVTVPQYLLLVNNGRTFTVSVDGTKLPEGLHFTRVCGHDTDHAEIGPLFELPITVVKPRRVTDTDTRVIKLSSHSYVPGEIRRQFIVPPPGATWMDITVTDRRLELAEGSDGSVIVVALQCVQLLPHTAFRDNEMDKYVQLAPGQKETFSFTLQQSATVEVATAMTATGEGGITLDVDVEFRGVLPRPHEITIQGGSGFSMVHLESMVRDEEVGPSAKLDRWQQKLVPVQTSIKPLGQRDIMPDGQQICQLILEYKFTVVSDGEEVVPRAQLLNGVLYESPFESQFYLVYDCNKKLLGHGDTWPSRVKCPKGENIIRYSVRHDDISLLQQLQGLVVVIERQLQNGKEVTVPEFASRQALMTRKAKGNGGRMLRKGFSTASFLGEPPADKLPKGVKPGDVLLGGITFEKGSKDQPRTKRPRGFPLAYVVPPQPESTTPVKPTAPDERTEEVKLAEKIRDVKIQHLRSISDADTFRQQYDKHVAEHEGHIPLEQAKLEFLDDEKRRGSQLGAVVEQADRIIGLIDGDALALHFGKRIDENDAKAVKGRTEMEEKKAALCNALARKARALIDLRSQTAEASAEEKRQAEDEVDDVEAVITEFAKWDSLEDDKYARLQLERQDRKGRLGIMLKLLNKLISDSTNKSGISKDELYRRRQALYERLGWDHLREDDEKWRVISNPKDYALF